MFADPVTVLRFAGFYRTMILDPVGNINSGRVIPRYYPVNQPR